MLSRTSRRNSLLPNVSTLISHFALYTGICVSLFAAPVFADGSLALVTRRGNLRVAIDASIGGPYLFWNAKTQFYDGFELEIIQEIANRLKIEARPINTPWAGQPESLESRQVDLIFSVREQGALTGGASKDKFAETVPYYRSSQRLLIRKDTLRLTTLRDLIGKRVGVVANSGGAAVIETYNRNRGNAIRLFSSRDLDRMVTQLRDRQLDAMLLDEPVAMWQVRNNPDLTAIGAPLLPISLVAIVNKDDESLKKAVDEALTQMRQEGTLEKILRRWNLWENQKSLKSAEVLPAISSLITMQFWG
ncbi:ABC transporter substrate-binding protein [Tumidithrix elongata RA019]|uniref:ABC transporter substrate-binding protein n=1 Tax=Tumidithrix elongata BACA0141 TaxID=2716417 RepID=A0AAW9Q4I4_9CYAN|nr:ABC transporter substrate-binding protein [Tumidithrix elongata RA019]